MQKVVIGNATLYQGDCLEILPQLSAHEIDAVITDPPYMIGAISVGKPGVKVGTWADMENAAYWFAAWFEESKKLLKETGYLITFGNWRSIPVLICALSKARMPATSCLVWDKEWPGTSAPNQLRPRYEVVMLSAMPKAKIDDRSLPDIFGCKWQASNMKITEHPAEKPEAIKEHLILMSSLPHGRVLDPFMGSGTTGVACMNLKRNFIGIEKDSTYFEIACQRIEEAQRQTDLFSLAPSSSEQLEILGESS